MGYLKHSPNDKYENFLRAYMEVAAELLPTKPRAKYSVPKESLVFMKKRDN